MSAILQTDSFVETQGCNGPKNIRNQPSRESSGVIMTDIQDKYITEFTLPYRNIDRYIKEIANSWDRLDKDQRNKIKKSFTDMGIMENFNKDIVENFNNPIDQLSACTDYVIKNPEENTKVLLSALWNPTPLQSVDFKISTDNTVEIRESMYKWSLDNSYSLHNNWRAGLIFFFVLLIMLILGIACGSCIDKSTPTTMSMKKKW